MSNTSGSTGNTNINNFQPGAIANNMNGINAVNPMNGMVNNMNFAAGNGNLGMQNSIQSNLNPNANLNNFNVNDYLRLQQQLQQQQMQQQMQQQLQQQMQQQMQQQLQQQMQQQLQLGSNMSNPNAQNMNLALMAAQQNQSNNNVVNNNLLQSIIGRNQQFVGGLSGQVQANMNQNPLINQVMTNQQQSGINTNGAAGLAGQNNVGATLPSMVGGANNFQLPSPNTLFSRDGSRRMRGGVIEPFPEKLHRMLLEVEAAGRADVISFVANGRAFAIHKADSFFKDIVPLYFRQSRLSSFKRQLNLYGFELINTGPARGGYYHEMFVKERPELCRRMRRVAVKVNSSKDGTGKKKSKKQSAETDDSGQPDPKSTPEDTKPVGENGEDTSEKSAEEGVAEASNESTKVKVEPGDDCSIDQAAEQIEKNEEKLDEGNAEVEKV